ncbi:fimbrial protein [Escherichia coli]|uniref:fimbrial protein n=2 Tax=Escherichia coli TaxID=562 RepID=UPI00025C92FA|nr:fimbrial protein [Escherichia coli]EIH97693.1 fimbrial protein [Escherichia coli 96.154]EFA6142831.1 fimbrial protein [Escherichia coli]EFA6392905.1 fimbrial protein [Escherichia coli]EFI1993447.1 fimbrial protein [Escherichia coli]EFO0461991.1 type 1 fimbrial protein [Escherichia coli]
MNGAYSMMSVYLMMRDFCQKRAGLIFFGMLFMTTDVFTQSRADLGVTNLYMRATLIHPACVLSTDSINKTVSLGVWSARQFEQTPSALPMTRFTINLENCGPTPAVKVSWTGKADIINSKLFSLTEDSTAKNVAVELLDWNRNRIPPGYTTPYYSFEMNASAVSIPFYVRYVRTGNNVTAGTANSLATFTLDYL